MYIPVHETSDFNQIQRCRIIFHPTSQHSRHFNPQTMQKLSTCLFPFLGQSVLFVCNSITHKVQLSALYTIQTIFRQASQSSQIHNGTNPMMSSNPTFLTSGHILYVLICAENAVKQHYYIINPQSSICMFIFFISQP